MSEKIAFVSWDYLRLVCGTHGAELELTLKGNRTLYSCTDSGCSVVLPTELYEKLLVFFLVLFFSILPHHF